MHNAPCTHLSKKELVEKGFDRHELFRKRSRTVERIFYICVFITWISSLCFSSRLDFEGFLPFAISSSVYMGIICLAASLSFMGLRLFADFLDYKLMQAIPEWQELLQSKAEQHPNDKE